MGRGIKTCKISSMLETDLMSVMLWHVDLDESSASSPGVYGRSRCESLASVLVCNGRCIVLVLGQRCQD